MKKKRGEKLQIVFSNRWLYTFVLMGLLIVVAVGVNALTAGTKPNPGHLLSEVSPPTGCTANQTIVWDGTNLICSDTPIKGAGVYQCPNKPNYASCSRPPCGTACDCTGQFQIGGGGIGGFASYCTQYLYNSQGQYCYGVQWNCLQGYLVN